MMEVYRFDCKKDFFLHSLNVNTHISSITIFVKKSIRDKVLIPKTVLCFLTAYLYIGE